MKLVFFDLNNSGHHWFYNFNIMKNIRNKNVTVTYITHHITEEQLNILNNNKIDVKVLSSSEFANNKLKKTLFLFRSYREAKRIALNLNADIFINLYFDQYILPYYFLKNNIKIVNILHWFPSNIVKLKLISLFNTLSDVFIVHTEDIKKKLQNVNPIIKVYKINYPVKKISVEKKDRQEMVKSLNLVNELGDSKILLYFGGTRHDKGIDIFLESLQYVNSNITVLIVGKEETFSLNFIQNKLMLKNKNVRCVVKIGYVPEKDVAKYFYISDVVILPYRSYFNGESGVLTDAVQFGKPVIVPNIIHFPQIINEFNCGIVYEVENVLAMAKAIDEVFSKLDQYKQNAKMASKRFIKNRTIDDFTNNLLDYISL